MDLNFIIRRLTELRLKREISEAQMSCELGHTKSYINGIVSGKARPTVEGLLEIIEYLGISPSEFFEVNSNDPDVVTAITKRARELSREDALVLLEVANRMNGKSDSK